MTHDSRPHDVTLIGPYLRAVCRSAVVHTAAVVATPCAQTTMFGLHRKPKDLQYTPLYRVCTAAPNIPLPNMRDLRLVFPGSPTTLLQSTRTILILIVLVHTAKYSCTVVLAGCIGWVSRLLLYYSCVGHYSNRYDDYVLS